MSVQNEVEIIESRGRFVTKRNGYYKSAQILILLKNAIFPWINSNIWGVSSEGMFHIVSLNFFRTIASKKEKHMVLQKFVEE